MMVERRVVWKVDMRVVMKGGMKAGMMVVRMVA